MCLIVGLGNPGEKYQNTRHNLGFMVVEALARKFQISNFKFQIDKRANAEILETKADNQNIVLAKPLTFMNASGVAVAKLTRRYTLDAKNLWVVHDDVDLPLGKIKIRIGGAAAGHHGVESIIRELGTDKFVRFRLGIGHPGRGTDTLVEKYVLREFDINEKTEVRQMIKKAVEAAQVALEKGLERAMNEFNQ
jgi:PTH1 family peptidyl-tRNA hydrolase